jgi:anthranilate phosphoribosyltransferase
MRAAEALERILRAENLDDTAAESVMDLILAGECTPPWIAGFLVALRQKGETVDEIAGFARAMRRAATPIRCKSVGLVDTCGTGGDGSGTFNISTAAAFVVAGAGGHVAKHGNRSVSSRCGSADVLEALGAELSITPELVADCVDEVGFGFLFAPLLHTAMRHAVEARRALGVRTVFNILGPLTNPAAAQHQLLGVFDASLLSTMADVLALLGTKRALLVHGEDGLDELSVCAPSQMILLEAGRRQRLRIDPVTLGLELHAAESLAGGDAAENARILRAVLAGQGGAARDVTLLNAAAALWAAGLVESLEIGLESAARAIDGGEASRAAEHYVDRTRGQSA